MSQMIDKVNLLGLSPAKMEAFFAGLGEKPFRARQVLQWIHQCGVDDFSQMSNLSKALRSKLEVVAEVRPPELLQQLESVDGTRKWLMRVSGGSCIETVFIPEKKRGTLCVSSQVGCSLDCSFCATGKQGFQRDLTAAEIVGQLWLAARSFGSLDPQAERVVSNVVLMGMGEPLLDFGNVVDAVNLMMNDHAYGLSKRRVTLSTSGVVPMLDELGKHTDVSLAVSLHAPNDTLRDELVPINRKYPIAMLLASVKRYLAGLPDKRSATIEYTLIDGVNDRPEHARQLAALLHDVPSKINLIPFNPFSLSDYRRVSNNSLYRFRDILVEAGYTTTIRTTRGDDIDAACGQLAGRVNDRTRRSERYERSISASTGDVVRFVQGEL
jgi:23S rRNA (adenine2503-C2)-methyltransferase